MNCYEFKEWLCNKDLSDDARSAEAERHTDICETCNKLHIMDCMLDEQIRKDLKAIPPPRRLLDRIEMDVGSVAEDKFFAYFTWKKLVPALAMAAMILLFFYPFAGKIRSMEEMGALATNDHLADLSMSFRSDEVRNIPAWFEDRVGFRITVPDMEKQGFRLTGGRKCKLAKQDVAYLFYEKSGKKISLFIFESDDLGFNIEEKGTYHLSEKGCEIKVWKEQNQVFVMVCPEM
ncbi:MAG: hypothetical protein GY795_49040 [Desulfobacterales bacterium]|nr:hypothetical protein [Desulfobacterales bacterium]